MKPGLVRFFFPVLVLAFAACLSGCATSSQGPLYSWGSYESQVYAYLDGKSREAQIMALENDRGKIEAGGKALPPGFYAHMGMLYAETGDAAKAIACFEAEKARFPEAAVYMDFLLGRYGK